MLPKGTKPSLRDIYNDRNPHYQIGVEDLKAEGEDEAGDEDTEG
jgi:hypothetical protein